MSVATAPRISRRMLERTGMTPEQELELLIAEQQRDDTYFIDRPPNMISLDAPVPFGSGTIGDLVGYDIEGEFHCFVPPLDRGLADPSNTKHGTIFGYRRQGCRCLKCRSAQATAVREYRANARKRRGMQ